ncbi:RNA-directed DNA polymerase [uncultured Thiodictyon sp.]|uniref:RNA-directed DNA polymerase n=1 Tax=uncultured Thiodictyon sp. TaxID=1846217 RepID=UPI0025EE9D88|nr:RNA-directed DNA polymerase [uncultured Thiodictyon sp.]
MRRGAAAGSARRRAGGPGTGARLMPRRTRVELSDIAAWDNLECALWAAARGKHARPEVAAFLAAAPAALAWVQAALAVGRLPVGRFRRFAIRDPKPRVIHAAPFPDRVAHHALVRLLEPRLELALVPTSFACRPGLGVHAAILHARDCARRWPWYLKLDVEHYFPNIPHDRLLALLARRFKGSVLGLIRQVLATHQAAPGCGLPIGALTSQHFANQYLGEADRFALARPECRAHARYMDDLILWCDGRSQGRALHGALSAYLGDALGLRLKPPCLMPSTAGLGFCGMRIYPGTIKLGARRRRAWSQGRRRWEGRWERGEIGAAQLQRAYDSLWSATLPADSRGLRRAQLTRRPAPDAGLAP